MDPLAALRSARIDPESIARPDMMIPADRVAWLLDLVAEKHDLPHLAIGAPTPGRQSRELGLAACVHVFRLLLGEKWAPDAIHFTHPAPKGVTQHRRFFGCPVLFDSAFDGLECRTSD